MSQLQLLQQALNPGDVVDTPDWVAQDMVAWFSPTGKILEPCRGNDAIYKYLPGAEWCEIAMGRDFFQWTTQVDWIISNPPFGREMFGDWLEHSFEVAKNIVYLYPPGFFFSAGSRLERCRKDGWLRHIRFYGNGSALGFPMGNPIAAMHFIRGYYGTSSWSWYNEQMYGSNTTSQNKEMKDGNVLDRNA